VTMATLPASLLMTVPIRGMGRTEPVGSIVHNI
jgi:hypothetical protein